MKLASNKMGKGGERHNGRRWGRVVEGGRDGDRRRRRLPARVHDSASEGRRRRAARVGRQRWWSPPPHPTPLSREGSVSTILAYSKRVQSAATRPVFVGCRGCGLQQRALLFLYHPARPPLCTRRPPLDCLNVKRTLERMTSFQLLGGWRAGVSSETPRDGWLVDVSL